MACVASASAARHGSVGWISAWRGGGQVQQFAGDVALVVVGVADVERAHPGMVGHPVAGGLGGGEQRALGTDCRVDLFGGMSGCTPQHPAVLGQPA